MREEKYTRKNIELVFGDKLDPEYFHWQNSVHAMGIGEAQILDIDQDTNVNPNWNIMGWCYSSEIKVRPKESGIVVLFQMKESFDEVWFHMTIDLTISFILSKELLNKE